MGDFCFLIKRYSIHSIVETVYRVTVTVLKWSLWLSRKEFWSESFRKKNCKPTVSSLISNTIVLYFRMKHTSYSLLNFLWSCLIRSGNNEIMIQEYDWPNQRSRFSENLTSVTWWHLHQAYRHVKLNKKQLNNFYYELYTSDEYRLSF